MIIDVVSSSGMMDEAIDTMIVRSTVSVAILMELVKEWDNLDKYCLNGSEERIRLV